MILAVGATGRVGGMILRELLARGEHVRALVRTDSAAHDLSAAGAAVARGDLKQPRTLAAALEGVDVVVTTASAGERGGADTPQSVDLDGNRHLIDAARDAGVRQFVFVSTIAAREDHPVPLPRAKALAEAHLLSSGVACTILAANGIMDVMFEQVIEARLRAGRPVTLVGAAARHHSFIAARDVAAFAVAAVRRPAAYGRRIALGGPTPLSWHDVVAAYERALDRHIAVESVPPGTLLPDIAPRPGLAELLSGLLAALETFDSPIDMTGVAREFRVQQTTVDELVRQRLPSLLPDLPAPALDA